MVAQVAMQGGTYAGKAILSKIKGQPVAPFKYFDKGNMAIIGRNAAAVNAFGVFKFNGYFAWVAWLGLHLYYLSGFRNRTMVGISWMLNYFFRSQQVRVISASTAKEEKVLLKQPEVATSTKAS
jgi:NADH dehydrogenase